MDYFQELKYLLFLDIETASNTPDFERLDERLKPLWRKKAGYIDSEADAEALFFERAAIFAEFGRVITISVGFFHVEDGELHFRVKSIAYDDEKRLLTEFKEMLEQKFNQYQLQFVAHNGKEFDYPYVCRRMLVNGIGLPISLQLSMKKPWEIKHLDTMEMWKFGDRKAFTSLELLATLFDVPTSKDDIDGSQVNRVYYHENDLDRIARYCQNDVVVTARLYLKLRSIPLELHDDYILSV